MNQPVLSNLKLWRHDRMDSEIRGCSKDFWIIEYYGFPICKIKTLREKDDFENMIFILKCNDVKASYWITWVYEKSILKMARYKVF